MKLYILTKVNGYAQLVSLTPFKSEKTARKEMRTQYNAQKEEREYDCAEIETIHAELTCSGSEEYDYSWDITEVDTDKIL